MNRLFSTNKITSLVVICVCVLFSGSKSFFKNKIEDPFLTLCENSDAYYIHSYRDITYEKTWYRFRKHISVDNKLVVNTPKGVEDYAFLNLSSYESNHLESITIRTLKADGSVVALDSSLVFKQKSGYNKFGDIHYPIPAVEPGDTIETKYVYYESLKSSNLKDYVSLYSNLPSINSQYTIKTSPDLTIRYKSYNDFPEPAVVSNDSLLYLQFSIDKVEAIQENQLNCLRCEKPYLYYAVEDKNSELRTWKDVYNEEFNFFTQPLALDYDNSSYYKRWKRKVIGEAKDSSKYYKFNLLHEEILKNFAVQSSEQSEIIKSSGYFLKEGRFDPISIRRFYRQLLEDLEIEYWAVFGKTKRLGAIDKHYIRKGEFDHVFFAFETEDGFLKFLYPNENLHMFQINEIPTSLYSTEAILVKPYLEDKKRKKDKFIARDLEMAEVDSVAVLTVDLPGMDSNLNFIQQMFSCKINSKEKKTTFRYRFKVSGGLSTELRSFYNMLGQNKEVSDYYDALSEFEGDDNTIQIDTVTERVQDRTKPFVFTVNAEGTLNNAITFINDSLVSVSIDKLIKHNQLENNSKISKLSYYLDYSYADKYVYYLNFPSEVEVLGLENINVDLKQDFGEYFFEVRKIKDNQLKLESNYIILKNVIPNDKLDRLEFLNEQVSNVKGKRFIVKLKG